VIPPAPASRVGEGDRKGSRGDRGKRKGEGEGRDKGERGREEGKQNGLKTCTSWMPVHLVLQSVACLSM